MFELIKDNFVLSQVFFELARETPAGRSAPPLHALNIVDLLSHTRLSVPELQPPRYVPV
jgi:hypothetical protein